MDNILQLLRLANIFAPDNPIGSSANPMTPGDPNYNPIMQDPMGPQMGTAPLNMMDIYQPEHQMTDRMTEMLGQFPERNKPGVLRKIFSSLAAGGGGIEAADRFMYAPYYNQLDDWKAQFGPVSQAANQERYYNTNMRQIATSMANQDRLERALALREQQGGQRIEQGQQRIDLSREKMTNDQAWRNAQQKINEARAKGGVFKVDDAGNARIYYRDGSYVDLPEADFLSYEQKAALQMERAVATARETTVAREGAKRDRLVLKPVTQPDGTTVYEVINLDEQAAAPVKSPSGETRAVPQTELEQGRELTNRALEVKNSNTKWNNKGWIEFDKNGRFKRITPPSWYGLTGPSQEEYNQIYRRIYGVDAPNIQQPGRTGATPSARPNQNISGGTAPPITPGGKPVQLPPPIDKRTIGMEWTFPNGKKGVWDGKGWVMK